MEHLRCVVERITYQNEENGYTVLKCAVKNYSDLVTVVGTMPDTHVGSVLSLDGFWKMNARYGRQFCAQKFEETLPATVYGIEKYLGSGLVKGIGPVFARKIVEKFGENTLDIIDETPEELIKVPGIGKVRAERIKTSWKDQKEIKNIMLFLQSNEVSTSHATKIYKTYGSEGISIVKENPYRLADDIWGIGFKTADSIAEKMGIDKTKFVRLRSGIFYTLNKLAEAGSKRMTELDFDAKYVSKGHRKNEIDELGEHFNRLSCALESTISELKSANNELKQDIEKKTEIDEMRKEFLSNVSHELKTPLALIQGYAEGLQECINDDAQSRDFYCEVIMDEADKMNQMVKKLLTLNQLEFGNEVVPMERFNLTELIHGIINSSSILLEQNDISVTFDESGPMDAWGDEFKVEEVVTNYLSNAIHHAEFDKKIRIWYTRKDSVVRVSVFNTGEQIPEEDLDNVWIKFYKVDKARTRAYGGSGIGLSIVKAIVDSMNQQCGVRNCQNGVEFWFELDVQ